MKGNLRNWLHFGLSPRERGNREGQPAKLAALRSIPARAGEPSRPPHARRRRPVYPRASGGTLMPIATRSLWTGLSPRERGNHDFDDYDAFYLRSIPARAGEPLTAAHLGAPTRVYPRASGGTRHRYGPGNTRRGLSPRERGNHRHDARLDRLERSIPARAGEPPTRPIRRPATTVYPRASGGTPCVPLRCLPAGGLSPRERGNLHVSEAEHVLYRSIPARAGEPSTRGAS